MSKLTDREINIMAFKHAALRVLAVALVIVMNWVFAFKIGWDVRNWQWWALSPALTVVICYALYKMEE